VAFEIVQQPRRDPRPVLRRSAARKSSQ